VECSDAAGEKTVAIWMDRQHPRGESAIVPIRIDDGDGAVFAADEGTFGDILRCHERARCVPAWNRHRVVENELRLLRPILRGRVALSCRQVSALLKSQRLGMKMKTIRNP
jgi:hypothetical protein